MTRRHAIYNADIRSLGGVVTIAECRDRVDSAVAYRIHHVSRYGGIYWQSPEIGDEDQARAAARILAEFVGAEVRQ